jgi:hypothetical protein
MSQDVLKLKREHRTLKQYAEGLAAAVDSHIIAVDRIMKLPADSKRGEAIGAAVGTLEMALHRLQHFGMDLTFEQMRKARAKREASQ